MDIHLLTQVENVRASASGRRSRSASFVCPTTKWTRASRPPKRRSASGLVILGHHYQRDEVIKFADFIGDSLEACAARRPARGAAEFIVFCGVHFMAESADILRAPHQKVILPDLAAGCSMADMAAMRPARDRAGMSLLSAGRPSAHPGDLHQLVGGDQSLLRRARRHRLHVDQRGGGDGVGVGAGREAADAARSASGPQHRDTRWACRSIGW